MKLFKQYYLPIIIISLITSVTTISIFIYGTYRIASSGIVSWIDLMKFDNLDIDNESVCWNYLRGRQFISNSGRIVKFDFRGGAYIIYMGNNKTVCAGYVELGEIYRSDENKASTLDHRNFTINNDISGRKSSRFELDRDGILNEFGIGDYYPLR